jgi:hypothetical protein
MPPLCLINQPINFGSAQQKLGLPEAFNKATAPMTESHQSAGSGATTRPDLPAVAVRKNANLLMPAGYAIFPG